MNMGTASLTREQLNEAIEQFADKIMEALGATVSDEEASEPEPTGTWFRAIGLNGEAALLNAADIPGGSLVVDDVYEYFRCFAGGRVGPWIRYTGAQFSNEEFAEEMRNTGDLPRIIHRG